MTNCIHPTALVDAAARIAADVEIGAYTIIGPHVEIGAGCVIGPHVMITGHTRIGVNNRIFQFCSLGESPQDKKYAGEPTRLEIGDNNTIREFCTLNTGTVQDAGVTRDASVLYGAGVQRAKFADGVVVANLKARGFARVLLILRRFTERAKLKNAIVDADARVTSDHYMRADNAAGADFHVRADDRIRADFDVGGNARGGINKRCRVDTISHLSFCFI